MQSAKVGGGVAGGRRNGMNRDPLLRDGESVK
jgi:hypothetical protein